MLGIRMFSTVRNGCTQTQTQLVVFSVAELNILLQDLCHSESEKLLTWFSKGKCVVELNRNSADQRNNEMISICLIALIDSCFVLCIGTI